MSGLFCDSLGGALRISIRAITLQPYGKNMLMEVITTMDIHSSFRKKEVWNNL